MIIGSEMITISKLIWCISKKSISIPTQPIKFKDSYHPSSSNIIPMVDEEDEAYLMKRSRVLKKRSSVNAY